LQGKLERRLQGKLERGIDVHFAPTRWRGSMMRKTSSTMLSRDDRLTYRKWMRSVLVFYVAAACILGLAVASGGSHKEQLDTNTARMASPGITATAEPVRAARIAP
jgi:hypothetical protein